MPNATKHERALAADLRWQLSVQQLLADGPRAADIVALSSQRLSLLGALHIAAAQLGASDDEVRAALHLMGRSADLTGGDAWTALARVWRAAKGAA